MRAFGKSTVALALLLAGCSTAGPALKTVEPKTEDQKTLYAIGLKVAESLAVFSLAPAEVEFVLAGVKDGMDKAPKVDIAQYTPMFNKLAQQRLAAAAEIEKKESAAFLAKLAEEKDAEKTGSGLVYIPVTAGTGDSPKATDRVKVHYKGTLRDGSVFDSSIERGQPATFPLNGVIACWSEGLQKMKVGGKAKLGCPSAIAYGDRGAPPKIKPGSSLLFEVELIGIEAPVAKPSGTPEGHP